MTPYRKSKTGEQALTDVYYLRALRRSLDALSEALCAQGPLENRCCLNGQLQKKWCAFLNGARADISNAEYQARDHYRELTGKRVSEVHSGLPVSSVNPEWQSTQRDTSGTSP